MGILGWSNVQHDKTKIICQSYSRNNLHFGQHCKTSQVALVVKNLPSDARESRDTDSIPELGRSPGVKHGNPLQYSCLENPMDRRAWWATVHGVAKSQTRLSNRHGMAVCTYILYAALYERFIYFPHILIFNSLMGTSLVVQ